MYKFHVFYVQISSIFCRFVQKIKTNNYRVAMTNMTQATRACVQCWRNYEYFMLKQCLENIGEGLLHAHVFPVDIYNCKSHFLKCL
jgi:hypothetical protein